MEGDAATMEELEDMDVNMTLSHALNKLKRKNNNKKRKLQPPPPPPPPPAANVGSESPSVDEPIGFGKSLEIAVSEFDYSIQNHFKAVDTIARLSGHPETLDPDNAEIQRFSDSITFLREWRDFKYEPRVVKFACQLNPEERDVVGGVLLPQFSSASVPKSEKQNCSTTPATTSSQDFVMNVGGAVWALDWCPADDRSSEKRVNFEFVAVAAHPPESSYHKIGSPLTGRGVIQIWCLSTVRCMKEDLPQEDKKATRNSKKRESVKPSKPTEPQKPRGRPRKKPINDSVSPSKPAEPRRPRGRPRKNPVNYSDDISDTDCQLEQPLLIDYREGSSSLHSSGQKKEPVKPSKPTEPQKPIGRPRKKPINDSAVMNSQTKESVNPGKPAESRRPRGRPRKNPVNYSDDICYTDSHFIQPLLIDYREGSSSLHSSDRISDVDGHVTEDSREVPEDSIQEEIPSILLLTAPGGSKNKTKEHKKKLFQSEGESSNMNSVASASCNVDSMMPEQNITCSTSCDTKTSDNVVPEEVALPKMMLCLAHNGKVAWDVKWRPFNASDPGSMYRMGYLAVLLGNGALQVWEVPLPHAMKLVFPGCHERIDPRFIKLQPVFRCSMLKCGDRQSIPLTVEWSASHDMILAGCHDGVVALWKFSLTGSSAETRPLLSFCADTGPIRALAWAPSESDLEGENLIVTAGHKGFKFWDIRDPFRPLWEHAIQGVNYSIDWLPGPRCLVGSVDDGTLWLVSLVKAANDIPVAGKSMTVKQGIHNYDCSSFSIWSVQASRLTGMVAYCDEEGKIHCFQLTTRSVADTRNRLPHYHCGSLLQEEDSLIVATPSTQHPFFKRNPIMKRGSASTKDQEKRPKELAVSGQTQNKMSIVQQGGSKGKMNDDQETTSGRGEGSLNFDGAGVEGGSERIEVFPPKIVAMHRVRWNLNKGSERWLCYGGAAGLVRCQEVDLSVYD